MYSDALEVFKSACERGLLTKEDLLAAIRSSETILHAWIDCTQKIIDSENPAESYLPSGIFKETIRECFINANIPRDFRYRRSRWHKNDYNLSQDDISIFYLRYHLRKKG